MVTACGRPVGADGFGERGERRRPGPPGSCWISNGSDAGSFAAERHRPRRLGVHAADVPAERPRVTGHPLPRWLGSMDIIPVLDLARGVAVHAQGRRPVTLRAGAIGAGARARIGDRRWRCCRRSARRSARRRATSPTWTRSRAARCSGRCCASWPSSRPASPVRSWWTPVPAQAGGALEVLACGASQVVVGLETLHAFTDLEAIVRVVGDSRVVFSLDLRLGSPVLHPACRTRPASRPDRPEPRRPGGGRRRRQPAGAGPRAGRNRLRGGSRIARGAAARFRKRAPAGGRRGAARGGTWSGCGTRAATARWWRAPSTPDDHRGDLADARRRWSVGGERLAVGRRLPVVLLDLELQQGQVGVPAAAQLVPDLDAQVLRQHLGRAVLDRQQRAVRLGKT